MGRWADRSTTTPVVAPYSRIFFFLTGRESVAALLGCVAGWARPAARIHIAGLSGASSLSQRIVMTATVDAACATLERNGFEVKKEFVEANPAMGPTTALAHAARTSLAELLIGTPPDPAALAGAADCPVLVVPMPLVRNCRIPPQRIFVASDGSATSARAVREAARIAAAPGAEIRVGYLACDPASARHPAGLSAVVLPTRREGEDASQAIAVAARHWRTDLVVLGAAGNPRDTGKHDACLATDVVQRTALPLLLVPQTSPWPDHAAWRGLH
ncbi:universal stress protein [Paraburkholderia sp. J12]|uniref:universal stress protein n=1 Tax=Paraburkholderia sp. J12 TaxID=2805432 RepID=UPI002ABE59C4|nr:universal stress protein [Paraburkholderia sp. J12]